MHDDEEIKNLKVLVVEQVINEILDQFDLEKNSLKRRNFACHYNSSDINQSKRLNKGAFVQDTACLSFASRTKQPVLEKMKINSPEKQKIFKFRKNNQEMSEYNFKKYSYQNFSMRLCRDCLNKDEFDEDLSDTNVCRFMSWRKLKYNKDKECFEETGFLQLSDSNAHNRDLWDVDSSTSIISNESDKNKEIQDCLKIVELVGDLFVKIIETEIRIRSLFPNIENKLVWKKPLEKIREMCDNCETSIFNGHIACLGCGFSVCIDCFMERKDLKIKTYIDRQPYKDEFGWDKCIEVNSKGIAKLVAHDPNKLIYVQLVPPSCMTKIYNDFQKLKSLIPQKTELKLTPELTQSSPIHTWFGEVNSEFLVLNALSSQTTNTPHSTRTFASLNLEMFPIFTQEWQNQRPVLLRNMGAHLSAHLWNPEKFASEFSNRQVNMIDCRSGLEYVGVRMSEFWSGFEDVSKRKKDEKDNAFILKLKDWPTTSDFKNEMPEKFEDLMRNLFFGEYTHREGQFNLVSNLPDFFLAPDLGPKMYIAYSSAQRPAEGTTNLHVDISDAVNLLIYVGEEKGKKSESKRSEPKGMLSVLEMTRCSQDQMQRYKNGEIPGAVWHLFKPRDADEIRNYFLKVKLEKGKKIKLGTDPIHDQTNYLDANDLECLVNDHGVDFYTLIQFAGDAVFIPAGAPHMVRNLNSCIKVALDFVSPQGVNQCMLITEQLRLLRPFYLNREDKLQIRNIVFHSIKKCLAVLRKYKMF